jgi:hypothetical protein
VGSADADVVQSAAVAQGDRPGFVDGVVSDPVVGDWVGDLAGNALGIVSYSVAGVARCGSDRCGRWWL